MATISGTFQAVAGIIHDLVHRVIPLLETPTGTLVNQQGTASGAALVEGTMTLAASGGTWTPSTAAAPADSAVIKNSATTCRAILAANSHASTTVYLQIFDSATVPADGTAPRIPSIPLQAGQTVLVPLGALVCANGLSWASSSTVATKTITALTSVQCSAELG